MKVVPKKKEGNIWIKINRILVKKEIKAPEKKFKTEKEELNYLVKTKQFN